MTTTETSAAGDPADDYQLPRLDKYNSLTPAGFVLPPEGYCEYPATVTKPEGKPFTDGLPYLMQEVFDDGYRGELLWRMLRALQNNEECWRGVSRRLLLELLAKEAKALQAPGVHYPPTWLRAPGAVDEMERQLDQLIWGRQLISQQEPDGGTWVFFTEELITYIDFFRH
ncbi:MAG TPA: hypothetical protein VI322_02440 [Candidatus Saccharimonadia bacterium]